MAKEIKISRVELLYYSQLKRRKIKVHLSNGRYGYISPCHEAWEIYGCTIDDKQVIMPIAEQYNDWLHEGLSDEY